MQNLASSGFSDTCLTTPSATARDSLKALLQRHVSGQVRDTELTEAAQEFEALFVAYLLKVMRETIEESGLTEGGPGRDIYTELFDQEVARAVARQSPLGISDTILRDLAYGVPAPDARGSRTQVNRTQASGLDEEIPDFRLPVRAPASSGFGLRMDPLDGGLRFHRGIDLAAPAGTAVCAALGGRVAYAGRERGYGNTVIIEHGGGLQTRYAHLETISVKRGDTVADGERVGSVGNTGRSTGPHLHFEVMRLGRAIDPTGLMGE